MKRKNSNSGEVLNILNILWATTPENRHNIFSNFPDLTSLSYLITENNYFSKSADNWSKNAKVIARTHIKQININKSRPI